MCKSETLGGITTIKTIPPFSLFQSDDGKGPLKCDEERSAIRLWILYINAYVHVALVHVHTDTHTLSEEPTGKSIPPLGV